MIVKWCTEKGMQHAYVHSRRYIPLGPEYDGNRSLCGLSKVLDHDTLLDISLSMIGEEYMSTKCCRTCYKRFIDSKKEIEL
jgi:hypothetical protein